MFKKPPSLKAASSIRSSARRALLQHLQALYPILLHATPEQVLSVVPNTLKQCGATTSGGVKAVVYTNEEGKPLWFELGHDAGRALTQSQQQRKKPDKEAKADDSQRLAEVIPTLHTLWLMPELLPRLPTWPQIVDPTLLSGSALMVPGLIPAPNTFPAELQWPSSSTTRQVLPRPGKSALVAITPFPSPVPLVVARLEDDVDNLIAKRAKGEKGKAATMIHCMNDTLWELGGKEAAPASDEIIARQVAWKEDDTEELNEGFDSWQLVDETAEKQADTADAAIVQDRQPKEEGSGEQSSASFTTDEIDHLLHLALLVSLDAIAKQSPSPLPMSTSAFYSSYVLPNRPSCWPPKDVKGRKFVKLSASLIGGASVDSKDMASGRSIDGDATDVRHSSAKKLAKWIKTEEKRGTFKSKEMKGKDTVITSVVHTHAHFKALEPYQTFAQAQRDPSTPLTNGQNGAQPDNATSKAVDGLSEDRPVVVIESFWRPSASSVRLFQEMQCRTDRPLSRPSIRKHVLQYIEQHNLVDPRNQALVKIDDPHLTHALFPKQTLDRIPPTMRRDDILDRLLTTSCTEYHRTSRLRRRRAAEVLQRNRKGPPPGKADDEDDEHDAKLRAALAEDEVLGTMGKGAAQPVKVDVKTRQGRKVVSLITNLDVYDIDAETFATDLMRIVGASASASPLPTSTAKQRKYEVFIQGDQRKQILHLLESQHGLDKGHVQIHDATKK